MPPPPMSTEEEASNGQWQGPVVMLQPVLIIALERWVKFIFAYVLSLISASWHRTWELLLSECVQKSWRTVCLNGVCVFIFSVVAWRMPDGSSSSSPDFVPSSNSRRRRRHLVFNLYVSECLHLSIPNTLPSNVALLLLILTKMLNVVFVLCCQRWHAWVATSFLP